MNAWPWIETLGRASLEGGLLIAVVWLVTRAWSGLPAWARGSLWWMASARLLIGLLPLAPLEVRTPELPVTAVWWPSAVAEPVAPKVAPAPVSSLLGEPVTLEAEPAVASAATPPTPARPWDPQPLVAAVLAVWVAGVGVRLFGLVRQGRRVSRMVRASRPLGGALSEALAPGTTIRFAVSGDAPVPMVTGLLKPVVLLPEAMLRNPGDDLRLAVAHELAHVRRGDLWLAWVPALAETLFWFHPLVSRAVREYVEACEESCDADALRVTGANPYDYGRLLVAFGVHRRLSGATAMPCGSPSPGQLKRRLARLRHFVPPSRRLRRAAVAVIAGVALVGLAPLRLVPTSAAPSASVAVANDATEAMHADPVALASVEGNHAAEAYSDWMSSDAKALTSASALAALADKDKDNDADWNWDGDWSSSTPPTPPTAPTPPTPPTLPTPPTAPTPPTPPTPPVFRHRGSGYAYGYSDDREDPYAFVLVQGTEHNYTGSGNTADWSEVQSLRKQRKGSDFMWVRVGNKRYLIEDKSLLSQVEDAFAPQRAIGERQSKLGEVQSFIGEQQSAIGEQQSKIGEKQSEVGEKQSELAAAMAGHRDQSEFERLQEDLADQMEMLSREQEKLSRKMEPLSRRQEELGSEMSLLGRDMERASREANKRVRSLIQEAIRNGSAKPLL